MRIGVISDSHGDISLMKRVVKEMGDIDFYIHLGDFVSDAKKVFDSSKRFVVVKGNCDLTDDKEEIVLELGGHTLLATHGHQFNIKYGYNNIYYRALERDADIVLFGHTHMPISLWYQGRLFFNPGSITYPRGGSMASYGIIEITDEGVYPNIYEV